MKRFTSVVVVLALSAGCHAPMPTWNMFRPDGVTRVPAPPTGGYEVTQPYYGTPPAALPSTTVPSTIAPTSAPVGTGFRPATSNRWSNIDDPAIGPIAKENTWEPTRPAQSNAQVADLRDVDVALASHEAAAPFVPSTVVVEHDGPIRILPSATSTVSNESEPRPFIPPGRVVDISQLPDAPVVARSANIQASTVTSQSATSQATATQDAGSDGGWKMRTKTLRVAGK